MDTGALENHSATIKADISILVVSKEYFYNTFKEGMLQITKETPQMDYNIKLHHTELLSMPDFLNISPTIQVDFVVYIIDPRVAPCVLNVEDSLQYLNQMLLFGRTCIIKIEFDDMYRYDDRTNELWSLRKKYGLHLIVDDLMNPLNCRNMAQRTLNIATTACGLRTGIPIYTGYGYDPHY